MLDITEGSGSISFSVRVVPRSSKTEIVGEHDGALRIKLKSPPVDGAANDELIRFLSKSLGIPKANINIVSGETSRAKILRITGLPRKDLERFLQGKI